MQRFPADHSSRAHALGLDGGIAADIKRGRISPCAVCSAHSRCTSQPGHRSLGCQHDVASHSHRACTSHIHGISSLNVEFSGSLDDSRRVDHQSVAAIDGREGVLPLHLYGKVGNGTAYGTAIAECAHSAIGTAGNGLALERQLVGISIVDDPSKSIGKNVVGIVAGHPVSFHPEAIALAVTVIDTLPRYLTKDIHVVSHSPVFALQHGNLLLGNLVFLGQRHVVHHLEKEIGMLCELDLVDECLHAFAFQAVVIERELFSSERPLVPEVDADQPVVATDGPPQQGLAREVERLQLVAAAVEFFQRGHSRQVDSLQVVVAAVERVPTRRKQRGQKQLCQVVVGTVDIRQIVALCEVERCQLVSMAVERVQ